MVIDGWSSLLGDNHKYQINDYIKISNCIFDKSVYIKQKEEQIKVLLYTNRYSVNAYRIYNGLEIDADHVTA